MKIGIICPMEEEIISLRDSLAPYEEITSGNQIIYKGKLGSHEILLGRSGIGKVQAAIMATVLIETNDVDLIINTGSAGTLVEGLGIGDVLTASAVAYHDVDVTPAGYLPGQIPDQPQKYIVKDSYVTLINELGQKRDNIFKTGLIVTGDQFIYTDAQVDYIKSVYPEALACEMEAAAIAQVANDYHKDFIIIRSISDGTDGDEFDDNVELAGVESASLVKDIINSL